jgi:hypothetical protein
LKKADPFPEMYLLPIYDEFIMGYRDRSAILEYKNNLKNNPQIIYDCMVVCEGQIIGTWKRTLTKKSLNITFSFFEPLNSLRKGICDAAIQRLGKFSGMKVNYD